MAKLTDYTAATGFDSGDILIKDGSGGTKKITAKDAAIAFAGLISPENHRNIYRGKNLGSSVTAAQKAAIQSGSFDDLFTGDYWKIGGATYRIADMDYWYNCGDTPFTEHHLVMVPDFSLYNSAMNDKNITTGGYVGSKMYTEGLDQAKTTIQTAFGDLLLTHREYLTNAVTDGYPSGGAFFDSSVELMNEIMVYGSYIHTPGGNGSIVPNIHTSSNQQLALFSINPKMVNLRNTYWLRDVMSATHFARVDVYGYSNYPGAAATLGVRPVFPIG